MSQGGLHSLATIIKRLEAATSRLEDLAVSGVAPGSVSLGAPSSNTVVSGGPPAPPPPPPPPAAEGVPPSVEAFDEAVINAKLKPFVELTRSLASPILTDQVGHVEEAFKQLRRVLFAAGSCSKPDQSEFAAFREPVAKEVEAVVGFPTNNRKERIWYNHLTFISEGIPSIGWMDASPKPGPHIQQMKESSEFYGNKIIKEFKDKEPKHVEWVRGWMGLLDAQLQYVKEFHTTGLVWNSKGKPLKQFSNVSPAAAVAPPPPPPPPPSSGSAQSETAPASGIGAVFADLNRGSDITKGLRKVDRSEMTHKNPELRAASTVPSAPPSTSSKPTVPSKPASLLQKKPQKPPKFELEGTKWIIEFQENQSSLVVDNAELNHTVNLFGCKNSTVQVKGKVNAVTLVNCTKTSVLVDSVVSSISVTNSPSFAVQITGSAPTIMLDATDSGQIYLSKQSLSAEIITAKCSAINISIPEEGEEEGVFVERAVPEQMITLVRDGKLVTSIVEHSG